MESYWIKFTDGTKGCCQGYSALDAVSIAQHLTGKTVQIDKESNRPDVKVLPYPASPVIWQFSHPVRGATPTFCYKPDQCCGRTSCPQNPSCVE